MLDFPVNCITPADRTEYAYRANELLRLLHNVMGKWHGHGIPKSIWDKLPAKARNRYPYKDKLTDVEWNDFRANIFEPAINKVVEAILEQRELLKNSSAWQIDIEGLI